MHRFTLVGLAVAGLVAAAAFFGTPLLGSNGSTTHADGATVIDDVGCALMAADSGLPSDLFTNESLSVATPSGNTTLTCHFDIPAGEEPAKALRNSGFDCGTGLGLTTNSRSVATPGGKALLRCQINPSQ